MEFNPDARDPLKGLMKVIEEMDEHLSIDVPYI